MMFRGTVQRSRVQRVSLACATVALLCALCPTLLLAQTWEIEVLDNGKQFSNMTDRSLRLDAAGHPHIAYGGDWLYYAWFDGAEWHYEVADCSLGVGGCASLALDSSGYPHVSYFDEANRDLKYAYKDEVGWHALTVDSQGLVVYYAATSLALDASGYPHVSYYGNGTLKYAYEDAGGWHIQTVDGTGHSGHFSSLALDPSGYPHISHYDEWTYDLLYAHEDAAGWHLQTVDSQGFAGWYTSIALDGSGYPHISYGTWTQVSEQVFADDLRYAFEGADGWHVETVDSQGYVGYYTSLSLDSSGFPHISYSDNYGISVRYAHQDAEGWQIGTVGTEHGQRTCLALDGSDRPHIIYTYVGDLKYAYEDGSGWHPELVDAVRDVGMHASLALDGSGNPNIAYCASGPLTSALRCAVWRDEIAHGQTVAGGTGDMEEGEISLVLDAAAHPHVSYFNDGLRYSYDDAGGWHTETVEAGNAGGYNSLALDTNENPHVGYYGNGDLKYAYNDGSTWQIETVDAAGNAGLYCSLALDVSGYARLSYWVGSYPDFDLRYAHEDETGWYVQILDADDGPTYASTPALALDSSGYPHICYHASDDLRYAYQDGAGWHLEDIGDNEDDTSDHSLVLSPSGYARMSYRKAYPDRLKYAYQDQSGWHFQILDEGAELGYHSSLELDSAGHAHISYYDYTSKDLKYAWMVSLPVVAGSTILAAGPALPVQLTALTVWPNPARGVVHARLAGQGGQGIVRLTVVDLLGRRVVSLQQAEAMGSEATMTLRLPESIPTGQYFLGVEGEGPRQFVPITVVK